MRPDEIGEPPRPVRRHGHSGDPGVKDLSGAGRGALGADAAVDRGEQVDAAREDAGQFVQVVR
ncbi:hypothetical protein [Embleya sp. NPDC005575]|uniref:hypothetical protein n=1 Tax=Embleya sp. NPDC005575 TaxID=3156892 RepID=UPI0033B4BE3E